MSLLNTSNFREYICPIHGTSKGFFQVRFNNNVKNYCLKCFEELMDKNCREVQELIREK